MLERSLSADEARLARRAEAFARDHHRDQGGHDHAHILAVTDYAIRIAEGTDEAADPLVVVLGALFHDLGRIGAENGALHGLRGAAIAREWLHSYEVDAEATKRILRAIARHTPTTAIPPEAVEERIVFDADALDRLGIMGMIRGLIGKRGSTEFIIEDRIAKRLGDYDRLHFDVSRRIGEALHADTLTIVARFRDALKEEVRQLHRIPWPVADGVEIPIPSLAGALAEGDVPDLGAALLSVASEAEADEPRAASPVPPRRRRGYARCLTSDEVALVRGVAEFVRMNHADLKAHDYAHVLTVVKNALMIAQSIDEEVDPLVLTCGALLHDIGWVGAATGAEHGLRGASIANEYLSSTSMPAVLRDRVRLVVVRHSLSSRHPPEAPEEKIVWDADGLAGVGLVGVARGIISGVGSMGEILEACLRYAGKRSDDLHYEESRRIADDLRAQGHVLMRRFAKALQERRRRVEVLRLPE
ncbi:MAG TPA: HD domain-containing protein [Longimicrobiales bacterium]|nr:HD domain-containing protein [Longimicrobiales bacterium]